MAENLEQNIRENAQGPKRAQGDSGSVEQHPLCVNRNRTGYCCPRQSSPVTSTS